MANPKFVSGSNVLQFSKGLRYPLAKPIEMTQVIDRTAAGTLQVENLGSNIARCTLLFTHLPLADYQALVDWYLNIAVGAANAFTYYDEEGGSQLIKLISSALDFKQTKYRQFAGELLVEMVG